MTRTRSARKTASLMLWVTMTTAGRRRLQTRQQLDIHALPRQGIQGAKRFIEQHYARLMDQSTCQRHPLLHAAGQLLRVGFGEAFEAH